MHVIIILLFSIFTGTALAETVTIEASQDNTLFESSQGALSNGAGTHIFSGQTNGQGIRRAVIAFKDLSEIPAGATITSAKLQLYLNRENSAATMMNLLRLQSDWGEGASDASGAEGQGAPAQTGDATWNHTFFDNMTWTTPGGDFSQTPRAQVMTSGLGPMEFGSTAAMIDDVQGWLDNPAGNFGWIVVANESVVSAKRFSSREGGTESRRPRLEIEYSMESGPTPVPGSDWSGPWFDPESDGEGYLVFNTPAGWLIYYFGYSTDGDRLWLVSNLLDIENVVLGQAYEFSMLVGTPGSFEMPTPSADLESWGTLQVLVADCVSGVFVLDGVDGMKTSNATKLIGIEGSTCMVQ